jgi:hypothetical protein
MPSTIGIARILRDAKMVEDVWVQNPSFSMGSVSLEQYKAAIAALENFNAAVQTKRTELTGLMNQRDDQALQMKELVTRARSTIRGFFGPNSSQYDEAGGTRQSERKPSSRSSEQPDGSQVKTTNSSN